MSPAPLEQSILRATAAGRFPSRASTSVEDIDLVFGARIQQPKIASCDRASPTVLLNDHVAGQWQAQEDRVRPSSSDVAISAEHLKPAAVGAGADDPHAVKLGDRVTPVDATSIVHLEFDEDG